MSDLPPTLPNNIDAERSVLGAILLDAQAINRVVDNLRPEDFFLDQHRRVFLQMVALKEGIDLVTLTEALQRHGELESAGGAPYLASLADGMPKVSNIEHYARIVKEKATLRNLIHAAYNIQQLAFKGEDGAAGQLDAAIESLSLLAGAAETDDGIVSFREAAASCLSNMRDGKARPRLVTGLDSLDALIGGLLPSEMWLFAAATGTGKTVLAQQIRRRACAAGHHVLYASGEMTGEHLQARELAGDAGIPQGKITRHPERISESEFTRLVASASRQCDTCKIVSGDLELSRIRRAARWMKARNCLSLIILDYDELISVSGADTEMETLRLLARAAKAMAMELECAVILVSQLRKALEGEDLKRPTLQLIYGSGAKTKFATGVLIAHRPYVQFLDGDESEATLFVLKNRDGRQGRIDCRFDVQKLEFLDRESDGVFSQVSGRDRASGRDQ